MLCEVAIPGREAGLAREQGEEEGAERTFASQPQETNGHNRGRQSELTIPPTTIPGEGGHRAMEKGAQEEGPREQYRLLHPTAWQGMDHLLLHPLPGQGPRDAHPLGLFPPSRPGPPQHHLFHLKQSAPRREHKQHPTEDQAGFVAPARTPVAPETTTDHDKQPQAVGGQQKVKAEEQESDTHPGVVSVCGAGGGGKKKRGDHKATAGRRGGGKDECQPSGAKEGKEDPEEIRKQEKTKENCDAKTSDKEGTIKTELVETPEDDCKGREYAASKPRASSNGPAHVGGKDAGTARPLGMQHPQELKIPVTLHPVPPGARIQFQGPPPSELLRMTKVPMAQVPLKMQSLLEPSVKIETKDVPLTVLPSDAGIR